MPKPLIPEMQNAMLAISHLLSPIAKANNHGFCLMLFPVEECGADVTYLTNLDTTGLVDTLKNTIKAIEEQHALAETTGTIQ